MSGYKKFETKRALLCLGKGGKGGFVRAEIACLFPWLTLILGSLGYRSNGRYNLKFVLYLDYTILDSVLLGVYA